MFPTFPQNRTPEQGHTAQCMAKAMIAAIENLRDSTILDCSRQGMGTETSFRLALQDNTPLAWADSYLVNGDTECICPPIEPVSMSHDEERYWLAGQA